MSPLVRGAAPLVLALSVACADDSMPEPNGAPGGSSAELRCDGCVVVRDVRVVDVDGVRDRRRVMLDGDRIVDESNEDGRQVLGAAEIVDAAGMTLLPGLWDVHVHLAATAEGPASHGDHQEQHLRSYLAAGVTSVIDTGADETEIFPLRARVQSGDAAGPDLRAVGPAFTVTGGHPCASWTDPHSCKLVDGPEPIASLVDAVALEQPDFVKLILDDGPAPQIELERMTAEQAKAVSERAAAHGLRTLAHVSSVRDAFDALDAGVAALAHLPGEEPLPAELLAAIVERGVVVMTTLTAYEGPHHFVTEPGYLDDPLVTATVPPEVLATLRDPSLRGFFDSPQGEAYLDGTWQFFQRATENLAALRASGARIAAGSDAGNFFAFHGAGIHRELELLVAAGLTPTEAIACATHEAAALAGADAELGRVAKGYRADLLLVAGDPSLDITRTRAIERVFLRGVTVDREAMRPPR